MSPHETLFLDPTPNVDIHSIANNKFIQFQTWDFAGDVTAQGKQPKLNPVLSSHKKTPVISKTTWL